MPELPEVETLRRELASAIKGKIIKSVEVKVRKMVKPLSVVGFQNQIKNKKILGVSRRAKVLILKLSGDKFLVIHLKLTGQLIFRLSPTPSDFAKAKSSFRGSADASVAHQRRSLRSLLPVAPRPSRAGGEGIVVGGHPLPLPPNIPLRQGEGLLLPNQFTHVIIFFKDGSKLYFNDMRKFGWMKLVSKLAVDKLLNEFGPEPLSKDFTLKKFKEILQKYPKRKIKQILLDQKLIAGIGNIYADESCFGAKIKPIRIVGKLSELEIENLFNNIKQILKQAISKKGTSVDTYVQLNGQLGGFVPYLEVYGRKGEKCKRCFGIIQRIKLNGRGTHFCGRCQK